LSPADQHAGNLKDNGLNLITVQLLIAEILGMAPTGTYPTLGVAQKMALIPNGVLAKY
jgi:hypothetical protein